MNETDISSTLENDVGYDYLFGFMSPMGMPMTSGFESDLSGVLLWATARVNSSNCCSSSNQWIKVNNGDHLPRNRKKFLRHGFNSNFQLIYLKTMAYTLNKYIPSNFGYILAID